MRYYTLCLVILLPLASCAQDSFIREDLEKYIAFRARHDRFSGVTRIYENDVLVFSSVHGQANRAWDIPNAVDTRFNVASVTKMFTAAAIGILLDRDEIDLEAPFLRYYPDFPDKSIAEQTTVRQLLSHTSGITDIFFESEYLHADRSRLRKLEDYDSFYGKIEVSDVPDDRMRYSNTNYLILGRIIEKITGRSYYDFIQEEIFDKAGMHSSGFFEADLVIPNLAVGYTTDSQASSEFGVPDDDTVRRNTFMRAVRGMPAGGAYSTADDLKLFFKSLIDGVLVTPDTYSLMKNGNRRGYGLGMQRYRQNQIEVIGHSGGFYGVSAMAFYLPGMDYLFISLSNGDFGAQPVFDRFLNNLAGFDSYEPVSMPADDIAEFEGAFEVYEGHREGRQIQIEALEDRLLFDNELEFFPTGKNRFFDIDNDRFLITFERDSSGDVRGFSRTDNRQFVQKARMIEPDSLRSLRALDIPESVLQQYLGEYQFGDDGMMPGHRPQLSVRDGALIVDNMMRFLPYEKDKFFLENDIGMRLHFQRGASGEVTAIHVMREDELVGKVKKLNQDR